MDFFAAQETARKKSGLLVFLFGLAVLAIIAVVYAAVHAGFRGGRLAIDLPLLAGVGVTVLLVIGFGSLVRTASLRRGGPAVAELLGARRVAPDTIDFEERKLLNVVEEMAIASGTPVPAVFVLDGESAINAFAAGYTLEDAAVAVTRGALEQLTRDELQGVIAHEFSHILNGDMRLNIRLIGILYGILLLAVIGRGLLRYGGHRGGGRDRDSGLPVLLVALALLIVGYIGVFFGRMIKSSVSRQREYLADSAAVQFTRNPDGLAGALKKIAAGESGSRINNHHAEELSHLFFANGLRSGFSRFLATHPPIDDRIRRLDPSWRGARRARSEGGKGAEFAGAAGLAAGGHGRSGVGTDRGARPGSPTHASRSILEVVGAPTARHLEFAGALLGRIPSEAREAAHDPRGARALLFAMLAPTGTGGSPDPRVLDVAREYEGEAFANQVAALVPYVHEDGAPRVALFELLIPTISGLPQAEGERLMAALERATLVDGEITLVERSLLLIVSRALRGPDALDRSARGASSARELRDELRSLLSAMAHAESGGRAGIAEAAFQAGVSVFERSPGDLRLALPAELTGDAIDRALDRCRHARPALRRRVLAACTATATHDGHVGEKEIELLLAVSTALGCPIPPPVRAPTRPL